MFGMDVTYSVKQLTHSEQNLLCVFHCGDTDSAQEVARYFKEDALRDPKAVTFSYQDERTGQIIALYSLSCSAIMIDTGYNIQLEPAVEIKMFAVHYDYQNMPYSDDRRDGTLSDNILSEVIASIWSFTRSQCGANLIVLYSVPQAIRFYQRNGFNGFVELMRPNESRYLHGCTPMFLKLV